MSSTYCLPFESVTAEKTKLARRGLRGALEVRTSLSTPLDRPICVYDLAEKARVEVKFRAEKSLGGLYENTSKTILIPSFRPPGRKAFTCAHELGHWHFGDGVTVDEIHQIEHWHSDSPKEQLANHFAAGFLMPYEAVERAFSRRSWNLERPSEVQVFVIASQLGVGYSTLIHHLRWSMRRISEARSSLLLETTPKIIRNRLLGHEKSSNLVVADRKWESVPVDLSVGDYALLPEGTELIESPNVTETKSANKAVAVLAVRPGIGRLFSQTTGWSSFVRVSRKNYCGRSKFRHLEDTDDN